MPISSLTDLYIDETYPRLVQTNDTRTEFADGLGNPITFGQTPTGSLLLTASAAGNTITFTKGDGSTFPVTVSGGGGSTDTGSLLLTASVNLNTITFTKGDGSTFPITLNTGSAITDYVTTSSFNAFTSSVVTTSSFNAFTSSVVTTLSFNSFTSSVVTTSSFNTYTGSTTSQFAGTASYAIVAQNGGVTKITAGSGITISPSNGLGNVTINSTAGAYNTATGSYGSFYDTTSQTAILATNIYSMSLNTTDISNGVYISGSSDPYVTYVKFTNAGVYNVQFSAQFANSGNEPVDVAVWIRKNDGSSVNDLPDTTGICTIPAKKGNTNGQLITSWNYYISVATNDFIQLLWHAVENNVITLETIAAGTNPVHPRTPSLILTAQRVDTFLSNTGSFSGSFTGTLIGTASWSTNSVTASYVTSSNIVGTVLSASYAQTASYAPNYVLNSATSSFVTNSQTASFVTNSQTSSFVQNSQTSSMLQPYVLTSVTSSMSVATASYVQVAQTASYVTAAQTASYVLNAVSSSYAMTASYTPNYVLNSATSSFVTNSQTASFVTNSQTSSMTVLSSSFATTASYVKNAQSASYVLQAVSSSYALTASYAMNGGSGGTTNTGSLLTTASVSLNTITFTKGDGSTFPITVDTGSGGGGGAAFPYTGSADITGSLSVIGPSTLEGITTILAGINVNIGDSFQGGIVAYILTASDAGYDPNYTKGLIATTADLSPGIQWYNSTYTVVGTNNPAIGAGSSNTDAIITIQGPTYTDYAAGLAYEDTTSGYSDWYLPSKDELSKLYDNRTAIGNFSASVYWSSTEADSPNDSTNAWSQDFSTGTQSEQDKASTYNVRAIRSFSVLKSRVNVTGSAIGLYSSIGVGIGTNNPQVPLDIAGDAGATGGAGGPRFLLYGTNGTPQYLAGLGVNLGQAVNSMGFFVGNNSPFAVDQATSFENFPYPSGYTTRFVVAVGGNVGIGTVGPSAKLHVFDNVNATVAHFEGVNGYPIQIVTTNTSMTASYAATIGSIGNGAGELCVKTGSADADWAPIVYQKGPIAEYTHIGVDLSGADFTIPKAGIYEITTAAAYNLIFPDPASYDGQSITVVNVDSSDANIDNTNTFAPYQRGKPSSQYTTVGPERMYVFKSIGSKWRGGELYY